MGFQGELKNIGLASVFQTLHQNMQSGALKLSRNDQERYLYTKEGRITMYSRAPGEELPLGEYLVRLGKISRENLAEGTRLKRRGQRLGLALEKAELIKEGDAAAAVRLYVEEELYDLFKWEDGSFEFIEGGVDNDIFDVEVRVADIELEPNALILEAARRVDEWDRINRVVGSLGEVYVIKREAVDDVARLSDARARRVAEFLDGRRDVTAVIRDSAMGRFVVCQAISKLVSERIARPISADELSALAKESELAGDTAEAARLLKRALTLAPNDIELRRASARALALSGEAEEAASEYKLVAHSLKEAGRVTDAADALRSAINLAPTDVAARERLFTVLEDNGGRTVALETGVDLADAYIKLGLTEKARDSLKRMLGLNPAEPLPLEKRLIETHLALGEIKGAIEVNRQIAHRYMQIHNYDEAGIYFDAILTLDSKDTEARDRVAQIQAGIVERVIEHRRGVIRALVLGAIALPVLILVIREFAARPTGIDYKTRALSTALGAAESLGRARSLKEVKRYKEAHLHYAQATLGFDNASALLSEFCLSWSWTLVAGELGDVGLGFKMRKVVIMQEHAEVLEAMGRFKESFEIYQKLDRIPKLPKEIKENIENTLHRLKPLVNIPVDI